MTLDTILGITSVSLAIAGLLSGWQGRRTILALLLSFLILITGASTVRSISHERRLVSLQAEILQLVSQRARSVDDIYEDLRYVEFAVVNEALSRCVDEGIVGHKVLEFQRTDGDFTRVRVYYRP
jgi:hypothetical protein